jgi:hypothetical protein
MMTAAPRHRKICSSSLVRDTSSLQALAAIEPPKPSKGRDYITALSSADFITNIAESSLRHTQGVPATICSSRSGFQTLLTSPIYSTGGVC